VPLTQRYQLGWPNATGVPPLFLRADNLFMHIVAPVGDGPLLWTHQLLQFHVADLTCTQCNRIRMIKPQSRTLSDFADSRGIPIPYQIKIQWEGCLTKPPSFSGRYQLKSMEAMEIFLGVWQTMVLVICKRGNITSMQTACSVP
jgi:hypothetical protein